MRIHRRFAAPPAPDRGRSRGIAYAIGNFDGLHQGHVAVVEQAKRLASEREAGFGVVTFEPHPRELLTPETAPLRLTRFQQKATQLRRLGVETLVVLPFDRALMSVSAEDFVTEILAKKLGAVALATGADFRFGHRRSGNVEILATIAATRGIVTTAVPPVQVGGRPCSSTAVRGFLSEGEIASANRMLGRPYALDGVVVTGDQRGRTIGFPTANLRPLGRRPLLPAHGVYAVRAGVVQQGRVTWHAAVANLGARPTFDGREVRLEAHLLDGAHDLYGQRLQIAFLARLRPEQRFAGIDALKAQIEQDCIAARRVHAANPF